MRDGTAKEHESSDESGTIIWGDASHRLCIGTTASESTVIVALGWGVAIRRRQVWIGDPREAGGPALWINATLGLGHGFAVRVILWNMTSGEV